MSFYWPRHQVGLAWLRNAIGKFATYDWQYHQLPLAACKAHLANMPNTPLENPRGTIGQSAKHNLQIGQLKNNKFANGTVCKLAKHSWRIHKMQLAGPPTAIWEAHQLGKWIHHQLYFFKSTNHSFPDAPIPNSWIHKLQMHRPTNRN